VDAKEREVAEKTIAVFRDMADRLDVVDRLERKLDDTFELLTRLLSDVGDLKATVANQAKRTMEAGVLQRTRIGKVEIAIQRLSDDQKRIADDVKRLSASR